MKHYTRPVLARLGSAVEKTLGLLTGYENDWHGRYRKRYLEP